MTANSPEKIIDLPRKNNIIEQLPEAQQALIRECLDKMTYNQALLQLAKPPPEGLALTVSRAALNRFYLKSRFSEAVRDRAQITHDAKSLSTTPKDPAIVEEAALDLLRNHLFNAALAPTLSVMELQRLYTILLSLKANDRHERKARSIEMADLGPPDLSPEMIRAMDLIYGPQNKPAPPVAAPPVSTQNPKIP